MDMLLIGLCLGVFGVVFVALAFGAAMRSDPWNSAVQPELPMVKVAAPARFFSERVPMSPTVPPLQIPIEVLLLQIENHVRMEQAAAESFLAFPTHDLLHSKTTSPFVN
ncbi:MAG: hypothetical protein ACLP6G_12050 [Terriglobales bacterium]